jgi:hypothetical protein
MRYTVLAIALTAVLVGCESKKPTVEQSATQPTTGSATQPETGSATQPAAHAQLTDLTTASTLALVRAAFNAKKGEARFLTLLAPT